MYDMYLDICHFFAYDFNWPFTAPQSRSSAHYDSAHIK